MGYHDTQQACLNGHQITARFYDSQEHRRMFCPTCGAETIHACPSCNQEIRGKFNAENVVVVGVPTPVPRNCEHFGKAFPWTEKRMLLKTRASANEGAGALGLGEGKGDN